MIQILKKLFFKNSSIPTFIGIGSSRSGTTWLARQLQKHPDVNMPRKQVHYFDRFSKYDSASYLSVERLYDRLHLENEPAREWRQRTEKYLKNIEGCENVFNDIIDMYKKDSNIQDVLKKIGNCENLLNNANGLNFYFGNYTDSWYQSLFTSNKKVSGEITPSYSMLDKNDVDIVKKLLPTTKIIYILRNPIDKEWSSFKFKMKNKSLDPDKMSLDEISSYFEGNKIGLRSDYLRTLENWKDYDDDGNLLILFFDQIASEPEKVFQQVCDFLDIDYLDTGLFEKKINSTKEMLIPGDIKEYLENKYMEQIKLLSDRFGGYPKEWLDKIN